MAWFWGSNMVLDMVCPPRGPDAGNNIRRAGQIRAWLFLGPAILFLGVYPVIDSVWRSLHNSDGTRFVGLSNCIWLSGGCEVP